MSTKVKILALIGKITSQCGSSPADLQELPLCIRSRTKYLGLYLPLVPERKLNLILWIIRSPVVVPSLFTVLPFILEFFLASAYIYPAYLYWLINHVIFSRKLCDTEICHIGEYLYFANTQIFNKYYKYFLIFLLIFLLFPFCHQ